MASDALLSEIERQQKYLAMLPADYTFPLFNAQQALESQRRSGYKDTAAASREIIDNAIEAQADRVDVAFDTRSQQGGRAVKAVAFIDNGSGMLPEMTRYALSWGGGTHFDDHKFIGRFGFGLPNASINQTRRVEVYSRIAGDQPFMCAVLDTSTFEQHGLQSIPEPTPQALPKFVSDYLKRQNLSLESGTVVVWVEPDRLTYRRATYLKEHLVEDFGVAYRYLLTPPDVAHTDGRFTLVVEGVRVQPVDPMFLLPEGRYFVPESEGGAILSMERTLPVKYLRDRETGETHLRLIQSVDEINDQDAPAVFGSIHVRVARLPVGFAEDKGTKKRETTNAHRRFDIRKSRRGMSFVRAGREVQTVDAFPRSPHDVASGLGRWPLLQAYAYHWSVEVRFTPELDEAFGITNDKQGVRPIEDFWRILTEAEIDAALRYENVWQTKERRRRDSASPPAKTSNEPTPAETAARAADVASGQRPQVPHHRLDEVRRTVEARAQEMVRLGTASDLAIARKALESEQRRRPYQFIYEERANGPVYEPSWNGQQVSVEINKSHPFYEVFYSELLKLAGGKRAKEALDLLLIALARTEIATDDPEMETWISTQRRYVWSPFLDVSLRALAQKLDTGEEQESTDD